MTTDATSNFRPSDALGGVYEETGLFEGVSLLWPFDPEPAQDPPALWRAFGDAIGPAVLERCYGWRTPRSPAPGEQVWAFRHRSELAAWLSLRPDPVEPLVWLALGIWPAWQRQGWAGRIRDWGAARAAAVWPRAAWLAIEVLFTNEEHLHRWIRKRPTPWIPAGFRSVPPPGAHYFARELASLRAPVPH